MSIITNLFFSWCTYSTIVPPLDGMHKWKSAKSRRQMVFRIIMKLGAYNKPANQQSNWFILNSYHAQTAPERKPFDTQVLENVAYRYRENTLTMLSGDFFNRQERCYAHLAK